MVGVSPSRNRAWAYVYAHHGFPTERRNINPGKIRDVVRLIDRVFWGRTLGPKYRSRGWRLLFFVQNHPQPIGMRRRDYPIAQVAVYTATKVVKLTAGATRDTSIVPRTVQTHPSYYPWYPHVCDGVRVRDWKEHLCHILAHEMIHVLRAAFCAPTASMYPAEFTAMNRWVYGHTTHLDADAPDDPGEIEV